MEFHWYYKLLFKFSQFSQSSIFNKKCDSLKKTCMIFLNINLFKIKYWILYNYSMKLIHSGGPAFEFFDFSVSHFHRPNRK